MSLVECCMFLLWSLRIFQQQPVNPEILSNRFGSNHLRRNRMMEFSQLVK
jgi:hypothetical protein